MATTMHDTDNGVKLLTDGCADIYIDMLYSDPKRGAWLLLSTDYGAVEVRVSPAGRKVSAEPSELTHRKIVGGDDELR